MSRPKDFVSVADWPRDVVLGLIARARELKALRAQRVPVTPLVGRSVLLYFEKPSLRTYVTFGVGVSELGGNAIYLPPGQVQIGEREPVEDVARSLSRWCDAIVARTYSHAIVLELAAHASIPVINALTDHLHPCQAVADALTIAEHRELPHTRLVYVGDGNNVAHSLIHIGGLLGMHVTVCTPSGYEPDPRVVQQGHELARASGGSLALAHDVLAAVKDADFLYTDVWASMGQEREAALRAERFRPYQLSAQVLAAAPAHARVLHCMPAHRGEEITAELVESDRSSIFDQAENRLHAQKAILELLISS